PPAVFTPLRLREMTLPNRIVVAPVSTYTAIGGLPDESHTQRIRAHAVSGAGLVLTEPVAVSADGRITPGDLGLYCPEHEAAWKTIVDTVHSETPAKIALHLSHAGRRGAARPRIAGLDKPLSDGAWPLLSASAIPYSQASQIPKEMACDDLEQV